MPRRLRDNRKLVMVALGGNAFQPPGSKVISLEESWSRVRRVAEALARVVGEGYRIVVTHGNGPQVGMLLEWMEALRDRYQPLTLDIADAMTQGWLGYMLVQALHNELQRLGLLGRDGIKGVVALVNRVLVSLEDPAFRNPTKPIGPLYTHEQAEKLAREKGWVFKRDPRGGWRRVVPSPDPIENIEVEAIRALVDQGWIVVASGGGGIPVARAGGELVGVEAVVDKDLAAERLATALGCRLLVILTDVDYVYLNYGKPGMKPIKKMSVAEALKYYEEGHFPPGSMGPKVLASIRFIESGGEEARIGKLENAYKCIVYGEECTRITKG